ncbi:response regulator [Roseimaritima ulvae]|uniref:histidine kinase n=1 Tax=Roseimaritima ulvae TaxID=980254 RepID=A0A5B9QY36_9BACT|nr:response regulator [Roseimaritima ulvae]QEG42016.1 Sensor histidine kinase RcsC [Roseimaritima ulvae]
MSQSHPEPGEKRTRSIRWAIPLALAGALAVLLISGYVTYRNLHQSVLADEAVSHTREVLATIEGVLADLSEAESAGRGFLLSGNPVYRAQFDEAVENTLARHADLKSLTVDDPRQQELVSELSDLIQPKIDLMKTFVSFRDAPQRNSVQEAVMLDAETQEMAAIRGLIAEIHRGEDAALAQRIARREQQWRQTRWSLLISTVVGCGLVLATYFLLRRHWSMQRTSALELRKSSREKVALARYNQRLLESTGEGIYGVDNSGRCTFMNRAGALILGGQPEDFLDREMHPLIHHSTADGQPYPLTDCPIYQASHSGDGCRVDDEVFWRLDGKPVPVEYSSFPLKDQQQLDGAVITFNDITARLRSRQELQAAKDAAEAANESKSQFLANMSHELRTPLNAVIMYSELLAEEAEDQDLPDFIPDLKRIRGAGRHLLELVNGLLDLSKVEAGKMELFPEPFDVRKLITEVAATVEPLVEENRNRLQVDIADDLDTVVGDVTKLRQVLMNLLSNASKFTNDGTVSLHAHREVDTEELVFRVRDTGIGMTEEQLARLFQPFMQADASTTRKYGGTGLGLAIIKRFTDLMGGEVQVSSVPQEGTTFTVRLPANLAAAEPESQADQNDGEQASDGQTHSGAPAKTSHTESSHTESSPAATDHPATASSSEDPETSDKTDAVQVVLVIDDDPAVRDILTRVLIAEGIRPLTASDGAVGLERAREHQPDLIILDVMMPKIDGWSVLSALKSDPQLTDIPVIMQSVRDDRDLGYMLGASEYLVKPVDRGKLVSLLRQHIGDSDASVLIVDDDPGTRRALAKSLHEENWKVVQARDGVEAMAAVQLQLPTVILLDLVMPRMDGFEFLHTLHQHPPWREIPVVVLTAKDLTAEDQQRLNGGVERVLEKSSLNRHRFLDEVRRLVTTLGKHHPGQLEPIKERDR